MLQHQVQARSQHFPSTFLQVVFPNTKINAGDKRHKETVTTTNQTILLSPASSKNLSKAHRLLCLQIKPRCKRGYDVSNPTKEIQQRKQEKEQFPGLIHKNMPVLAQGDSCFRGDSLEALFGKDTKEGTASTIFPQNFSTRKSLCSSNICACSTSLFSQLARNTCSAASPLTTSKRRLTHVQPMQGKGNEPTGTGSPLKADRLSKRGSHEEQLTIKQPPQNCLASHFELMQLENVGLFADHLSGWRIRQTAQRRQNCQKSQNVSYS